MRKWVVLIVTIVIMTVFAGCLGSGEDNKGEEIKITYVNKSGGAWGPVTGYTSENDETIVNVNFNDSYINEATFKLTWTDLNDAGDPESAQDDQFTIQVTPPNGSGEPQSTTGAGSSLTLTVKSPQNIEEPQDNGKNWVILITIVPGEGTTAPGLGQFIWYADSGNDWTLRVEYKYMEGQEAT